MEVRVLPDPDSPTKASTSPGCRSRLIQSTAGRSPQEIVRSRTVATGSLVEDTPVAVSPAGAPPVPAARADPASSSAPLSGDEACSGCGDESCLGCGSFAPCAPRWALVLRRARA